MPLVAKQKQKTEAIVRMQKAEEKSVGFKGGSPMFVGLGGNTLFSNCAT
jgi:hypothetical protein